MLMLIPLGLVVTALLVIAYIAGSELCLPAARSAVLTGNTHLWKLACRLVAMKEWALIALVMCFLLLSEHTWRLFTANLPSKVAGITATGLLVGMTIWELSGRTQKKYAEIMSHSLGLVLPAKGWQRELYDRGKQTLICGTRADQDDLLRDLLSDDHMAGH